MGEREEKKKKKITSNRKPCPFIASATFNHWCKQTILHRACESTCAQSSLNYLKVLGIEIKDGGRKKRTEKFNIKEDVLYFLSTPARYPPHTHTRTGTDPWANAVIYMLRYCLRLTYPTSEAASIWQDRRASRFPWSHVSTWDMTMHDFLSVSMCTRGNRVCKLTYYVEEKERRIKNWPAFEEI